MILSNFSIFRCLPVRRNRRLHSTGLTINLTKPNNHPNSALNHLYSRCEWGSRAVLCILSTETVKCHSFAFRNHTFLPSKTMQCFKSNRAAHPQSNMIRTTSFATRPDFHELPSDWTIIVMANSSNGSHLGRVHHIVNWPCLQFLIGMYPTRWSCVNQPPISGF